MVRFAAKQDYRLLTIKSEGKGKILVVIFQLDYFQKDIYLWEISLNSALKYKKSYSIVFSFV